MSSPPASRSILLVEDDRALRHAIARILAARGFSVASSGSAGQALRMARRAPPDLVVTDWVLGGGRAGTELCSSLKASPRTRPVPIVVLTGARVEFKDELEALRCGADLYLTKGHVLGSAPATKRFVGYLECLLTRPFPPHGRLAAADGLVLDLAGHMVCTPRETIKDLPTKLFDLLYLLALAHPRTLSRDYLVRRLWRGLARRRSVDVAVCRLKERIDPGDSLIESVHAKGYRLRQTPTIRAGSGAGA